MCRSSKSHMNIQSKRFVCILRECCGVAVGRLVSSCNVAFVFCCLFQSVRKWKRSVMHENWRCAGPSITQRTDCELPWYIFFPIHLLSFFFFCISTTNDNLHMLHFVLVRMCKWLLFVTSVCGCTFSTCCDEFLPTSNLHCHNFIFVITPVC